MVRKWLDLHTTIIECDFDLLVLKFSVYKREFSYLIDVYFKNLTEISQQIGKKKTDQLY